MAIDDGNLAGLIARLRSGALPLAEYLGALCDRIDAREPELQALLPEPGRRERMLREAAELERRHPEPAARPPLFGVPVGVKDIFRVDGFPTRCGSTLPPELFAGPESVVVTRLRAAGALVLGKTVTTEFAYFEPGPTRNPCNPGHTPGGSSSGSAAAVAGGYCPVALGSQTVGSVIRPAAFCGVAGFKPTHGRLSVEGVIPYAPSLDHVGFFVPGAEDLAPVLAVLDPEFAEVPPPEGALGVPEGPYLELATPEARAAFEAQVQRLEVAGGTVRRVRVLEDVAEVIAAYNTIAAAELARTHAAWFRDYAGRYRPRTAAWIREGLAVTEAARRAAYDRQATLREELAAAMDAHGLAAWITPAAPGPAPEGIGSTGDPSLNGPWTYAGMPAVTFPAGRAGNGLPLGLQCVGRRMEDNSLVALARKLAGALRPVPVHPDR